MPARKSAARVRPARVRPARRAGTRLDVEPRYRIAPGVAHREVEGQLLVLGPGDSTLLTLNASGRVMWDRLTRGAAASALIRALTGVYRIEADRAARDVRAFLETLRRRRLIVKE